MPELEEHATTGKAMPAKGWENDNVSDDESDLELDSEGVVSPDNEPPQKASPTPFQLLQQK